MLRDCTLLQPQGPQLHRLQKEQGFTNQKPVVEVVRARAAATICLRIMFNAPVLRPRSARIARPTISYLDMLTHITRSHLTKAWWPEALDAYLDTCREVHPHLHGHQTDLA